MRYQIVKYFDVTSKQKKTTIIFLILLVLFSFALIGVHFLPFFTNVNSQTLQNLLQVTGMEASFGKPGMYASNRVNPNIFLMIGTSLGALGSLLLLVFTIWFIASKKYNRFMFFMFALTTPCYAILVATEFFIIPLYKTSNVTGFADMQYIHYWYYVSLIGSITLFLTIFITIVVIALQGDKSTISVESN